MINKKRARERIYDRSVHTTRNTIPCEFTCAPCLKLLQYFYVMVKLRLSSTPNLYIGAGMGKHGFRFRFEETVSEALNVKQAGKFGRKSLLRCPRQERTTSGQKGYLDSTCSGPAQCFLDLRGRPVIPSHDLSSTACDMYIIQ